MRVGLWIAIGLFGWGWPRVALADVDLTRAFAALAEVRRPDGVREAPRVFVNRGHDAISLLIERLQGGAAWPNGATRFTERFGALTVSRAEAVTLRETYPGFRFDWSPGRRLAMDRADGWIRASNARAATGRSGAGVVIGIVDSGVDVTHPELRNADGSTRVRWLVDFGRPPRGRHTELEAELGCATESECAVYDAADIDELLSNAISGDEPRDTVGHGTLVASLAAGNGSAAEPSRYVGVAPEAELVVARVTTTGVGITDADIVNATRFVFDRAEELGFPAVANLSLGSDFGPHDGSSVLSRALASLVGDAHPGRALVVAAGNSAALFIDPNADVPLGIHTEVFLPPEGGELTLPIRTPERGSGEGAIDVWLEMRPGDDVSVGVDFAGQPAVALISPGNSGRESRPEFEVAVHNQDPAEEPSDVPAASVLVRGDWEPGAEFALRLSGHGSVSVWVQGAGALDPLVVPGPLLPGGVKPGTVGLPAVHPDLIAVGATLNRTEWTDAAGKSVSIPSHGSLAMAPLDTTLYFSAAGPNSLGVMKPDLVAPGGHVIGAMSKLVDPRVGSGRGMFAANQFCPSGEQCYVADDAHAVASGTSLAAPLVSGAIALLFEADPSLTQSAARALLQAGARPLEGYVFSEQQVGIGALDIEAAFAAEAEAQAPNRRTPGSASWLAVAAPYAHPDPDWPVVFHAELRDDQGRIADGFDAERLDLEVSGASVVEPLSRLAPGLYRFSLAAPPGSAGQDLEVRLTFDGRVLLSRELEIRVAPSAPRSRVSASGGCSLGFGVGRSDRGGSAGSLGLCLLLAAALMTRAKRTRPFFDQRST